MKTVGVRVPEHISLGQICEKVHIKSDRGISCLRLANNILRLIYMF